MAIVVRKPFSKSTQGRGIKVVATSSPGTDIHVAVNQGSLFDEVWLWAMNIDSSDRLLTVQFGGTTAAGDHIIKTIPAQTGLIPVVPGLVLTGGVTIKAFAAAANVVLIFGFIDNTNGQWNA